ncbi:MAG: hypothetical protein J0H65_16615 [Rhizobiales bacterium]|nr:hypothetical protein [Hyphomicrobiales bacterium]
MSQFIPKLARITAGKRKVPKHAADIGHRTDEGPVNVARLARLMPQVRKRLAIDRTFSDAALLASLAAVARHPSHAERWHAAEASTLGQYLAASGKDMHRALVTLLSLLPRP